MKNNKDKTIKKGKTMKDTHYSIPNWEIKTLVKIGETYKVPFYDAPFDNSVEEGYYDIDKLRNTSKWKKFLEEVEALKVHYEYAYKTGEGNKIYMPIQIWEKRENA